MNVSRFGGVVATLALLATVARASPTAPHAPPASSGSAHASTHPAPSASAHAPTPKASASPAKPAPRSPTKSPARTAALLTPAWAPPAYVAMVKQWHSTVGATTKTDGHGRPKLVLFSVNRGDRIELEASSDSGSFSSAEIDRATAMLRAADGDTHPVDPNTLALVYQVQRHFGAPEIRFLSGYRTPHGGASNHGFGRAIDLVVPGATDEQVVTYARTLGFVGVGLYPTGGFVHLDVRQRSYFWVDRSAPGMPNRTVGILGDEAARNDEGARAAGRVQITSTAIGRDVDAALDARAKALADARDKLTPPVVDDATSDDESEK